MSDQELSAEEEDYLKKLFGNPKKVGSLGSVEGLYQAVKKENKYDISLAQIKKWLQTSDTYTLHKPYNRKFKRNSVIVGDINQEWQADIANLYNYRRQNRNFKYFLLVIDVLSKFVRTVALKTKNAAEVTNAFKKLLPKEKGVPKYLHTDRGTEFTNATFQKLLKDRNIKHFFTASELKASIAERAIKTLKLKLFKNFTETRKMNWVDHLQDVTITYNSTVHSSIGMAPKDVNKNNEDTVWNKLYKEPPLENPQPFKFNVNDKVRIIYEKAPFDREYNYHWTGEVFIITDRYWKQNLPKYRLKDWFNESVIGSFYQNELQKVIMDDNTVYKIEKIVGRRVRNGERQVKIKWTFWPARFNSWIPAANIQNYS